METLKVKFIAAVAVLASLVAMPLISQAVQPNIEGKVLGAETSAVDINSDGVVNSFDAAVVINNFGQSYPAADLNKDGIVDQKDLDIVSSWWFATH